MLTDGTVYREGTCETNGDFKVNVKNSAIAVTNSDIAIIAGAVTSNVMAVSNAGLTALASGSVAVTNAGITTLAATVSNNAVTVSHAGAVLSTLLNNTSLAAASSTATSHNSGTSRVEHTILGTVDVATTLTVTVCADIDAGTGTYYTSGITQAVGAGNFVINFVCAGRYFKVYNSTTQ